MDPSTGVFLLHKTDLYLPDVIPLVLTRTYNSGDNLARPFGRGMTHPYVLFLWSAQQYQQAERPRRERHADDVPERAKAGPGCTRTGHRITSDFRLPTSDF